MRTLREVHLYLGCVFTPLLIFYAVTGAWQSFGWHTKGSYMATPMVQEMSRIHMNAKWIQPSTRAPGYFRYYALAMSIGLVTTSILGVIMALKVTRRKWLVGACLAMGVLLPWSMVYS